MFTRKGFTFVADMVTHMYAETELIAWWTVLLSVMLELVKVSYQK